MINGELKNKSLDTARRVDYFQNRMLSRKAPTQEPTSTRRIKLT